MLPSLSSALVSQLSGMVATYIAEQRQLYRPRAAPPSASQLGAVRGFFSSDLLESVRVLTLHGERVSNPGFYPILKGLGFANLPDQAMATAITFVDVVVSHERLSHETLFHELVHVEQYGQLGIGRFSELYVRGFLAGGGYDGIPLEVNAYTLGARYEAEPERPFSVADEVRDWLVQGKF
jgi:hypothetical protein